jgi:hypothetical protein
MFSSSSDSAWQSTSLGDAEITVLQPKQIERWTSLLTDNRQGT